MIKCKRVYESPSDDDGRRILVDKLWPRGLTKERAKIHLWLKEIAPSDALRKWFTHDPAKWDEFKKRYFRELENNKEFVRVIQEKVKKGTVTFVYGAKDTEHNSAVALKEYFEQHEL